MESMNKQKLQKLTDFHGINCVSIYIPTHRYGKEVNEGKDAILLKNHYQEVRRHLNQKGIPESEADQYLQPIMKLIGDKDFWRRQEKGLAVFLGKDFFEYYKLPYEVDEFSLLSTSFHLEQLIPWLNQEDMFYILALSLKKIRLFIANEYEIRELDLQERVPEDIDLVLSYYDFTTYMQQHTGAGMIAGDYHGQGRNKSGKGYDEAYIDEYFRHMNDPLDRIMIKKNLPVVLAAVDYLHPIFKKANKTLNVYDKGIMGNPDEMRSNELFQKGVEIIRPHLEKRKHEFMEKYRSMAGTGKASHNIQEIAPAAVDGRIDALFVVKGVHKWGIIKREDNSVQLHDNPQENDQCLVSKSAVQTVLHDGNAFLVDKESLPEEFADAEMAAVFRW